VRALWQSFLDPAEHRPYVERLRRLLERAAPAVDFDVVGIRPPDRHLHPLTEVRCGLAALRNALWAERSGYDGVAVGHFQEPFLHELQAAVGIPVVGLGTASLQHACTLADRLALVTIDEVFVPWHEEQVRRLGLRERVVGIAAVGLAPDAFMAAMERGPAREALLGRIEQASRPLREAGAGLLVPAGALPAVALCEGPEVSVGGLPLLDVVSTLAVALGAAVELWVAVERGAAGPPAAPSSSAALEEFLAATGGALTEPVR
jgi:allantoin racemase